jgi:hypothetical protein
MMMDIHGGFPFPGEKIPDTPGDAPENPFRISLYAGK